MVSSKQEVLRIQREVLRYIDQLRYKVCKNAIRLNATNTDAHELMKYRICRQLNKEGCDFLTEVFFENGKRCDGLCLDTRTIYEVIVSETEKSQIAKVQHYYPEFFQVIFVDARQEWQEKLIH